MKHLYLTILFVVSSQISVCLNIDRVILSTNDNSLYIEFWPIVSKMWKEIIGIQPTLALIGDKTVDIDETLGDVIRFKPISGVSTALHAQVIRLLLPAYFEDDVCLISDIDMIPIDKHYFFDSVSSVADNQFVVYRNEALHPSSKQYPMCYIAAKGKVFKEVFKINHISAIPQIVVQWSHFNWGWTTDQKVLYSYLNKWPYFKSRCTLLNHAIPPRIDRSNWSYNTHMLTHSNHYVDAHCLRPYSKYEQEINLLTAQILEKSVKE